MAILGNSFAAYHNHWTNKGPSTFKKAMAASATLRAVTEQCVLEVAMCGSLFSVASAFNNLSLHLFPPSR
jgi:hypothetical protein